MEHKQQGHACQDNSLNTTLFAELYQRYAAIIFTYVQRHVPSRQDAEDILLEVFLAALENEKLPDIDGDRQRAWLLRVAHNKMVDYHRHARNNVPLEEAVDTMYCSEDMEPEQVLLHQEEQSMLRTRLKRLPAVQQEVVRMRFMDELPYAEIARAMNKREGAIRVLLWRSLRSLREFYNRW